jgi:serine/threonine protein phosphatase PrpC
MGGHAAGEVASRVAVQAALDGAGGVADAAAGADLLQACNRAVYAAMERGEGAPGMGTTLAGLVLRPDGGDGGGAAAVWLNCGDSKLYRQDPDAGLVQLSVDDTPGPKLADGRTAAHTTPMLSQSLGGQPAFAEIDPHAEAGPAAPGTRWLLCTDGLSDLVGPAEIADLLAAGGGTDAGESGDAQAVAGLFRLAMDRGGKDNVAIALVRLADPA